MAESTDRPLGPRSRFCVRSQRALVERSLASPVMTQSAPAVEPLPSATPYGARTPRVASEARPGSKVLIGGSCCRKSRYSKGSSREINVASVRTVDETLAAYATPRAGARVRLNPTKDASAPLRESPGATPAQRSGRVPRWRRQSETR